MNSSYSAPLVPSSASGLPLPPHPAGEQAAEAEPLALRLDFHTVFRRVTLFLFLGLELYTWYWLKINFRFARRKPRILKLLFLTPRMVVCALLVGGAIAILADLFVRFVVRPLVRSWFYPPADIDQGAFHLASSECVEQAVPARQAVGRRWRPGMLVRTNQRVWFFPRTWDLEPWRLPLEHLAGVSTRPGHMAARGLLLGLPDPVVIRSQTGEQVTFAVAEPAAILAWQPARAAL